MHGAYCTHTRHRHRGGILNKTPPPTELQIPATVTTLVTCMTLVGVKVDYYCAQYQPSRPTCSAAGVLSVGRSTLQRKLSPRPSLHRQPTSQFAFTRPATALLERIAVAVGNSEPLLLVGETGTGKTSAVQYLAELMCKRLLALPCHSFLVGET